MEKKLKHDCVLPKQIINLLISFFDENLCQAINKNFSNLFENIQDVWTNSSNELIEKFSQIFERIISILEWVINKTTLIHEQEEKNKKSILMLCQTIETLIDVKN